MGKKKQKQNSFSQIIKYLPYLHKAAKQIVQREKKRTNSRTVLSHMLRILDSVLVLTELLKCEIQILTMSKKGQQYLRVPKH